MKYKLRFYCNRKKNKIQFTFEIQVITKTCIIIQLKPPPHYSHRFIFTANSDITKVATDPLHNLGLSNKSSH